MTESMSVTTIFRRLGFAPSRQAQAVQTQLSGVNLDAEAVQVMELQKGYDAAGKMVSVIDSLTNTLVNMVT